jgi:hypothetical protein
MFGEVLSKAWGIIWKNKVLWIFGFLAGCGAGGGSQGFRSISNLQNFTGAGSQGGNAPQVPTTLPPEMNAYIDQFTQSLAQIPTWFWILLLVIFILVWVLAVVCNTAGRAGLVLGTWAVEEGAEKLSFGQLFDESLGYFWRVFFLEFVVGLISFTVALVMALPLLFAASAGVTAALCFIPMCCIAIPVFWLLNVWQEQAVVAAVGENMSFSQSLSGSWKLVTKNLGLFVIMSLILGIGSAVVSFVAAFPLFIVMMPLVAGMAVPGTQNLGSGLLVYGIALLCYTPFLIVINSVVKAYLGSAWTLTYRWITLPPKLPAEIESLPAYSDN